MYRRTYCLRSGNGYTGAGRAATERLVLQDKVKFLVNSCGDNVAETLSITEPNKVMVIGFGFTDESVQPNLQYYYRGLGIFLPCFAICYLSRLLSKEARSGVLVLQAYWDKYGFPNFPPETPFFKYTYTPPAK
jgi:hypothetical protein